MAAFTSGTSTSKHPANLFTLSNKTPVFFVLLNEESYRIKSDLQILLNHLPNRYQVLCDARYMKYIS